MPSRTAARRAVAVVVLSCSTLAVAAVPHSVDVPPLDPSGLCSASPSTTVASFEDSGLEAAVRTALGLAPGDDLTCSLLESVVSIDAGEAGITSLAGVQNLTALASLNLPGNRISDLTPLVGLANLQLLELGGNEVTDLAPLRSLTSLEFLWLYGMDVTDVSALAGLASLNVIDLGANPALTNIEPLLANKGLGAGDVVGLGGTRATCSQVSTLVGRGVTVAHDCAAPVRERGLTAEA